MTRRIAFCRIVMAAAFLAALLPSGRSFAFETEADEAPGTASPQAFDPDSLVLPDDDSGMDEAPPTIDELESIEPVHAVKDGESTGLPFNIREDALKEAALSYGARGGLAWRTYNIRKEMDGRAAYMDKVFNFQTLLIPAPSGLLIEPPMISEQDNAMLISGSGTSAAVSDRIYAINKNSRIVSIARSWRNYLEREWGEVTPPPDILRPTTREERAVWIRYVREGWDKGVKQADEIFQEDLNQLTADYRGMVRYRMLLAQGMVTPPYASQTDRGVTGDGNTMRVGDRQVDITGMPSLNTGSRSWKPASR